MTKNDKDGVAKSNRLAAANRVVDSIDDKMEEDEDEEGSVNDDDDDNAIIDMDDADFGMASPPKSPNSKEANPGRFLKTMPATSRSTSSSSSSKMITVSIKRRASRLALRVPPPELPPVVTKEVKGTSAKIEYGGLRGSGKFHVGEDVDIDFK